MRLTRVACDVAGCKREDATEFTYFKDRTADGAGSMENNYYVWDMCPGHLIEFTKDLLDTHEKQSVFEWLSHFNIKLRTQ